MKVFRFALIFLGFLTLGVIVALMLSPKSISYSSSVKLDLPISEVWTAYTDPGFMPRWIESLDTAYYKAGSGAGEGSEVILRYRQNDQQVEVVEKVTTWLTNQLLVTQTQVDDLMRIDNQVRFSAIDDQHTEIQFGSEVHALKWLMRFSLWGSGEAMRDRSAERLRKFAEMLEFRNSG